MIPGPIWTPDLLPREVLIATTECLDMVDLYEDAETMDKFAEVFEKLPRRLRTEFTDALAMHARWCADQEREYRRHGEN